MTDLTSAKKKIQLEETQYRAAVSEATAQKMGGTMNWIIDNSTFAVGDVVQSMLTEAQFQGERNATWVLMDGRSVVGSDYEALTGFTNVPDLVTNKRFLRQASSDGNLGVIESDLFASHTHTATTSYDYTESINHGEDYGYDYQQTPASSGGTLVPQTNSDSFQTSIDSSGGSETRPHNIQVNFFIKINN